MHKTMFDIHREKVAKEVRGEALIDGERKIILTQLETKFGTISAQQREQIARLNPAKLVRLGKDLLRANSLDELKL